jgi:hypothetical protein
MTNLAVEKVWFESHNHSGECPDLNEARDMSSKSSDVE